MKIPPGYVDVLRRAVAYDDKTVVVIEHTTRDTAKFFAYDRETGKRATFGFHNTPAAALRTAEAWFADGGDDFADYTAQTSIGAVKKMSPRYRRALDAAYPREV